MSLNEKIWQICTIFLIKDKLCELVVLELFIENNASRTKTYENKVATVLYESGNMSTCPY